MYAKKSLGQNFLKSKEALKIIRDECDPVGDDIILEVGPGKGALTEVVLSFPAKVVALEKDHELVAYLKDTFKTQIEAGKLEILEKDALEFDPEVLRFYNTQYKLIGNIPYYITGALLKKFLSTSYQPEIIVFMLQKEVAKRIVARDGKESILSLSVKAYGIPKYVKTVQAKYFSPVPKVDSAILKIDSISKDFFTDFTEEEFFTFIRAGFAHKRKRLMKNLEVLGYTKDQLEKVFTELEISPNTRAEDVPLPIWKKLLEKTGR